MRCSRHCAPTHGNASTKAGEADQWRRRHARHYATFAQEASAERLPGPDELTWRPRVRAELDNLRTAVNWALDASEPDDLECGLRIIGFLAYGSNTDLTSGIGAWATKAIPQVDQTTPGLRTAILGAAAFQATFTGEFDRAINLAQRALVDGIPPRCPAPALPTVAWADALMREQSAAYAVMLDGLDKLAAAEANDYSMGGAHMMASITASLAQDSTAAARTHTDEAVRIARRSQNPSTLANALFALGQALIPTDRDAALVTYEECITVVRSGATNNVLSPSARPNRITTSRRR